MSIAEGVYGKIFVKNFNGIPYAIKVVTLDESSPYETLGVPESYTREVTIMKEVNHPNVMKLVKTSLDFLMGQYSIMMQYIRYNLKEFITTAQIPYSSNDLLLRIARGLYYLEQKNILHGDLKPENIMVMKDGTPKIIDFGVSILDPTKGLFQSVMTTFGWKAPEEIEAVNAEYNVYRGFKMLSWTFGLFIYDLHQGNFDRVDLLQEIKGPILNLLLEYFKFVGTPDADNKQFSRVRDNIHYYQYTRDVVSDLPIQAVTGDLRLDSLIKKCLTWNPDERISMRDILIELGDSPERELTVFEKLHANLPEERKYKLSESFVDYLSEIAQSDDMKDRTVQCSFLAAAIMLKSRIESDTIHSTCLCLAAKVLNIDSLYLEIQVMGIDFLTYSEEEADVIRNCGYNLHITTSMSYLNVLLEEYDEEEANKYRLNLFNRLIKGEDVLYTLPEDILE